VSRVRVLRSVFANCVLSPTCLLFENTIIAKTDHNQGRRQKNFRGGEGNGKKPKNSTIKPLSTISVPRMKIQGDTALPLLTPVKFDVLRDLLL